ncbi:MAG: beta-propeller fold lactonase family protein [Gemmatimonadales bacterium]
MPTQDGTDIEMTQSTYAPRGVPAEGDRQQLTGADRRFVPLTRALIALLTMAGCADDRLIGPGPDVPAQASLLSTETGGGTFAYVANLGADNVSVIRVSDNSLMASVPVGHWPFGVAFAPDAEHVYVANILSHSVSVIRTSDNTVTATVPVGEDPHGVAVAPGGASVYVTNHASSGTVSVIRTIDNVVTATVPVGVRPYGMAFSRDGASLYVTNTISSDISIISTADNTVTGTIVVGDRPRGVVITPDGAHLYVGNQGSNTVSVIRTSDHGLAATVPVGDGPFGLAVTPDGAQVYVTNIFGHNVSVIRTSDNTVTATVPVGTTPVAVAITRDGALAYVTNQDLDNLSVIRTSDNAVVGTVAVGDGPRELAIGTPPSPQAIAFTSTPPSPARVGGTYSVIATGGGSGNPVVFTTPGGACRVSGSLVRFVAVGTCTITANQVGNTSYRAAPSVDQTFVVEQGLETFAYVANHRSDNVSIIRTLDNTIVATVPVGDGPFGVAVTPDEAYVYVTNIFTNNVSVIRTSDNTVTATVRVGGAPHRVAVMPGGAFAYVANHNSPTVSALRISDNTVTATVTVGSNPYGLAFTPDGAYLYVTNTNSADVSVIRTADNTVTATLPVGASPRGAAVTPDGARLYVLNQRSNSISVFRTSDNTLTATVPVGNGPFDVTITPDGAYLYVSNIFGNDVSVIRTSDNTVTATVSVGNTPAGVAITPDGAYVYVANQEADNLSVIRTSDNSVSATVAAGGGPSLLAIGFAPVPQAITFTSTPPSPARVGTSYTVAATGGGSGNPVVFTTPNAPCSVNGSLVRFLAVGTCTITANQAGNASYGAAPAANQAFEVAKGDQTITITTSPPDPAYVGNTYSVAATGGGSGNAVVFTTADPATCTVSGSTVTFAGAGSCQVLADQAGGADYNAAPQAAQTIAVVKQAQGITFTSTPPNPAVLGGSYTAAATGGGSGNPVTFSSLTPAVCTVSGSAVAFVGVGACTLAADQAANTAYLAAPQQTQQLSVIYPFTGFFQPVDGAGTLNVLKAGKAVPIKFSLGGDRGLNILQGTPASVVIACGNGPRDVIEETAPTSQAGLRYEPGADQYVYVWPTDKVWAPTCRNVTLTLNDGTTHSAVFDLTK